LLKLLDPNGYLVTIDIIGTQNEIARQIVDQDFRQSPFTYAKLANKGNGRLEIRQCWATSDPEYLTFLREVKKWSGLRTE
jgi:predicted transposase YbfD/YdcC